MINIFEKYNRLTDEEKEDLEDLYIVHQLLKQIDKFKNLKLTNLELNILFKQIKKCLELSNISCKELSNRLLEMLNGVDITIYEVDDLEIDELIDLLSNKENDFKNIDKKKDILFAITTNKFYSLLLKYEGQYILICEKDNGVQYQRRFRTLYDLAFYIVRKFLQEHGELYI